VNEVIKDLQVRTRDRIPLDFLVTSRTVYKPSKAKQRWAKHEVEKLTTAKNLNKKNDDILNDLMGLGIDDLKVLSEVDEEQNRNDTNNNEDNNEFRLLTEQNFNPIHSNDNQDNKDEIIEQMNIDDNIEQIHHVEEHDDIDDEDNDKEDLLEQPNALNIDKPLDNNKNKEVNKPEKKGIDSNNNKNQKIESTPRQQNNTYLNKNISNNTLNLDSTLLKNNKSPDNLLTIQSRLNTNQDRDLNDSRLNYTMISSNLGYNLSKDVQDQINKLEELEMIPEDEEEEEAEVDWWELTWILLKQTHPFVTSLYSNRFCPKHIRLSFVFTEFLLLA